MLVCRPHSRLQDDAAAPPADSVDCAHIAYPKTPPSASSGSWEKVESLDASTPPGAATDSLVISESRPTPADHRSESEHVAFPQIPWIGKVTSLYDGCENELGYLRLANLGSRLTIHTGAEPADQSCQYPLYFY